MILTSPTYSGRFLSIVLDLCASGLISAGELIHKHFMCEMTEDLYELGYAILNVNIVSHHSILLGNLMFGLKYQI